MVGIQASTSYWGENNWGEYVGVELIKELTPNRTYYVEYWIQRATCINPKMDIDVIMNPNFGILFYTDTLRTSNHKMLIGDPQIKADTPLLVTDEEWLKVSKYFTPKYRYNKICIGQFWKEDKNPMIMTGYYLIDDVLIEELKDFGKFDKDAKLPIGTIIPLNHVQFVTGSVKLSNQESYTQLKELVSYLNLNPSVRIRVKGHTDSIGIKKSNLTLSKERAKFIAKYVIEAGIDKDRIEWEGYGDNHPIGDNKTEEGRAVNRRVEFEVIGW
ncbi:MAG: OmpA family protein [Saprospiraceae bacterium]|nr:OmpA family protein [Saprospiraceae bacterium]